MADDSTNGDDQGKPAGTGGKDWEAEAEKWKALARKHEDQAKANHAELTKLKADSDATKSEQQKMLERIEAAEKKAADAEARQLRAEVAAEKGLTAKQAARLQGASREELQADADELLEVFKPAGTGGKDTGKGDSGGKDTSGGDGGGEKPRTLPPSGRPKEKLTSGAVPAASGDKSPAELAESILASGF